MQFLGRVKQPLLAKVWYIRAEGKVKFFWWLMLQNRNWTAEHLRARGLPHDSECCLCYHVFETADHLALQYPFAKEVWANFIASYPCAVQLALALSTISRWWKKLSLGKQDEERRKEIYMSAYVVWHIWKERGHRIF